MAEVNVKELLKTMRSVDKNTVSLAERLELASAAQTLLLEVERPWDTILRMAWSEPSIFASLRILIDLKFFEKWVAIGGDVSNFTDLGRLVGCDPALMERLTRNLATHHLLTNPGPHEYGLTDFTRSLADPDQSSAFPLFYDCQLPVFTSLPAYLALEGYRNPVGKSPASCAFSWGRNFNGTLFDYFAQNPTTNENFGRCMKGVAGSMAPWVEQYPTERLIASDDDVVVVDVGGSTGHDINAFQRKYKLSPGRLVVQDLPEVVAQANVEDGIELMAHDFFTPQPIKGARAYYLHSVLHDWPDHKAQEILENLKPAVVKGKSKVLIHEHVLWPQGNTQMATYSDLLMLGSLNGCERTIDMWKRIIEPAGFTITETYTSPTSPHTILELDLA